MTVTARSLESRLLKSRVILQREGDGGYVPQSPRCLVVSHKAILVQKRSRTLKKPSNCTWKMSAKL